MGYGKLLPTLSLAVQATFISIVGIEIHEFIQTTDNATIINKDEDGDHAPMFLSTLDLSHWTSILYISTLDGGVEKALRRL